MLEKAKIALFDVHVHVCIALTGLYKESKTKNQKSQKKINIQEQYVRIHEYERLNWCTKHSTLSILEYVHCAGIVGLQHQIQDTNKQQQE